MNLFVNEYKYDDEYLKECINTAVDRYVDPLYNKIMMGITFVTGLVCIFHPNKSTVLGLILLVAVIAIRIAISMRPKLELKKARKILSEKGVTMNQIHRNVINEVECVVNDDLEDAHHLNIEKMTDHFESKNYIFLNFGQKMYIPFKKDGFIVGTLEDFRKFIEKYPARNPMKPTICSIFTTILALEGLFFVFFM